MANLFLLHLSDIHFRDSRTFVGADAVASAIRPELELAGNCDVLVVVTGDVAFSGAAEQYRSATEQFRKLQECLKSIGCVQRVGFVLMPGNHDCDFTQNQVVRDMLLTAVTDQSEPKREVADLLMSPQVNFFKFAHELSAEHPDRPTLLYDIYFEFGIKVWFRCLNSAWLSKLHERPSELAFPAELLAGAPKAGYELALWGMHHPLNWFEPNNAREIQGYLSANADFVLTGHEHDVGAIERHSAYSRNASTVLTAHVLAGAPDAVSCGFQLVHVSKSASGSLSRALCIFEWRESVYAKRESTDAVQLPRVLTGAIRPYAFKKEFDHWLDDLGIPIQHRFAKGVNLWDLFIAPKIGIGSEASPKEARSGTVELDQHGEEFSRRLLTVGSRWILTGIEFSGKTAFAKYCVRELSQCSDKVLLYVSAKLVRSATPENMLNDLAAAYRKQFQSDDVAAFFALPIERRIVIVDDFHAIASTSPKRAVAFLKVVRAYFGSSLILSARKGTFQEVVLSLGGSDQDEIAEYFSAELREFGPAKRLELIEAWYALGNPDVGNAEHDRSVIAGRTVINQAFTSSFMPSFPGFVLLLLNQLDAFTPAEVSGGTLAELYKQLIERNLVKTNRREGDFNIKQRFLAALALEMHSRQVQAFDASSFDSLLSSFETDRGISMLKGELKEDLLTSRMLSQFGESVQFAYPYIFYFFLAAGVSEQVDAGDFKVADGLLGSLHRDESANAVAFLTLLSGNRTLIGKVRQTAREIFPEVSIAKLEDDTEFMNAIYRNLSLVLENRSPRELRKEASEESEKIEASKRSAPVEAGENKLSGQLLSGFKAIEILGQTVRSLQGELSGAEKLEMAQECFELTQRLVGWLLEFVKNSLEALVELFVQVQQNADSKLKREEAEDGARAVIFLFAVGYVQGLLIKLSSSIGSVTLRPTFDKLTKSRPYAAQTLIDVAIRLESLEIPNAMIIEAHRKLEKNTFADTILKMQTLRTLRLYASPYQVRQQLCQALGINFEDISKRNLQSRSK